MSTSYVKDHIPKGTANNRRPALSMAATTITIHNTGNPSSSAKNERAWLTNSTNTRTASFHIVVDQLGAIECLPLNENAWHAGDGSGSASGNCTSIGIEICESGDYAKTLDNAVELVASMLKVRGWGVDRLRRHYDWSGKICPRKMYDEGKWTGWTGFKARVATKLQPTKEEDQPMTATEKKAFEDLTKLVKEQGKQLEQLQQLVPAPAWFGKEFKDRDLGSIIHDPKFTTEGWRILAVSLRAIHKIK
ncbi:peptidoglycan recognition protein family protein [Paenibacillus sinopodophylli]|uniref:peptidoglycan recognition protein family protein n=1 Tax=Paenibacillus sinopodophylli TaxID=1837342 RepID=UPI00110CBA6F|nr:N-acetylmuramoyl-L-alanine amidase [Paenibacillus sinopodophylli]